MQKNKQNNELNNSSKNTESAAFDIAEKISSKAEYVKFFKLWDVIFEKTGALYYLRVLYIPVEDENGKKIILTSDAYDSITAELNEAFDKEKFIENVDILEIGSAGTEIRLRKDEHFEYFKGRNVNLKYRDDDKKIERIVGILEKYETDAKGEKIIIVDGKTVNLKNVIKIHPKDEQTER